MRFNRRQIIQSVGALPPLAMLGQAGILHAAPGEDPYVAAGIAMEDDRVWTLVSVNGAQPRFFWFDTGAWESYISEDYARAAGLEKRGYTSVAGIGGERDADVYRAKSVEIGGAFNIDGMSFAAIDWMNGTTAEEAAGIVGGGLFMSRDSDLDLIKGEWRIYPNGRKTREGYYPIPDSFKGDRDYGFLRVDGHVGGFVGKFLLDTGAPGWVFLDKYGSEKSGLWTSGQPYAPTQSRGFGRGRIPTRLYRVDRMKLYKFVLQNALVAVTKPSVGLAEFPHIDGLIGLKALRYFHMSFDAKARQLYLKPNGLSAPTDHDYPMSGLWFEQKGDRITIDDVGIGSPAAAAGCQVGDEVRGIGWDALLKAIYGAAGDTVAFDYTRGGKAGRVEFQLAPYL